MPEMPQNANKVPQKCYEVPEKCHNSAIKVPQNAIKVQEKCHESYRLDLLAAGRSQRQASMMHVDRNETRKDFDFRLRKVFAKRFRKFLSKVRILGGFGPASIRASRHSECQKFQKFLIHRLSMTGNRSSKVSGTLWHFLFEFNLMLLDE